MEKGCAWDRDSAGRFPREGREPGGKRRDLWPHVLCWMSFGKSPLLKFPIPCQKPRGFGYRLQPPPGTDSTPARKQCVEQAATPLRGSGRIVSSLLLE